MFNQFIVYTLLPLLTVIEQMTKEVVMHSSWFGVGDGTVVMWSLVWVLLPISLFVIFGLLWAAKAGQFQDIDEIARRQLDIED
ncbi:MAG: cbb3-type cytochrome oxidase assembly protein [Microcoleus sp.]|uniref:cbb3-type cytochrome oxidase assembly protein n=1 Tax=Microcoleus sp. A006_D1 TaxID=3055267 RepID=UPI002297A0BE|nr:cbb3-type cytochrome oxidase assembly protein [Microcoleus sp. CAN_BIN18]